MDFQLNSVTGLPSDPLNSLNNLEINPLFILIIVAILVIFYIFFSAIKPESSTEENGASIFFQVLLWSIFIILVLLNGISYFFNINIIASLQNIFSKEPRLSISSQNYLENENSKDNKDSKDNDDIELNNGDQEDNDNSGNKLTKEVFNIPGNHYTYNHAQALCKAFEGRLANYKEIEEAYNKGANWCNYGWSQDQMALFPTNIEVWKKLRKIKGHENDCGRPGINGGYIANPNVRFGANCFGKRPEITEAEELRMENGNFFPQSLEELRTEKLINKFKHQINNILVSPFNNESWSMN